MKGKSNSGSGFPNTLRSLCVQMLRWQLQITQGLALFVTEFDIYQCVFPQKIEITNIISHTVTAHKLDAYLNVRIKGTNYRSKSKLSLLVFN